MMTLNNKSNYEFGSNYAIQILSQSYTLFLFFLGFWKIKFGKWCICPNYSLDYEGLENFPSTFFSPFWDRRPTKGLTLCIKNACINSLGSYIDQYYVLRTHSLRRFFLGIVTQNLVLSKSNRFHVVISWFYLLI